MTAALSPRAAAARAALWMAGTLLSFSAMAVAIRELSAAHGTFEIIAYRSAVGVGVLGALAALGGPRLLASRQPRWQLRRNLVHFLGQAGWTYGIGALPLATVFTLEFTMPAWTALLAVAFLGERMSRARAVAIAGGIVGVLIILRPDVAVPDAAALAVLGAAIAYAGAHTMTKYLTRSDGAVAILFWMSAIQLPLGVAAALVLSGGDWTAPAWADAPWIAAVGLAALAAHFCLARALALADATVVMPLDFLRLPLIAGVGALVYAETPAPEVALGAAIIVASLAYALRRER